ncbi:hypothetical protein JOD43_001527 [Pullulanibacillus pueri]|nr:hypothetical protein [Pullulanibacillus pueri]
MTRILYFLIFQEKPGKDEVRSEKVSYTKASSAIKLIGVEDARLLRKQQPALLHEYTSSCSEKTDFEAILVDAGTGVFIHKYLEHKESIPKLAEAAKDNRLKSSRPVTTPILPTSCGMRKASALKRRLTPSIYKKTSFLKAMRLIT